MLRYGPRAAVRAHLLWCRVRRAHDAVNARLLAHPLVPAIGARCCRRIRRCLSAIPDTTHLVAWNDLREPSSFDMPNLDEARVKEKHVRRVPRDMLCRALPLNRLYSVVGASAIGIAMTVDIESKFCF